MDDYGDLNVEFMSNIDMFDVRNQLPEKMQSIKDKADEADQNMSETSCIALLSELHTACGEESCTDPNMDSFQLSVDQVGSSVNTHTKLKVEAIGEFYDFQRYTVQVQGSLVDQTPLSELRPVRCCRDDEPTDGKDIWYKSPIAISNSLAGSCPFAWEQKWTSDVAVPALPVLPTFRMTSLDIESANRGTTDYSPLNGTWTLVGDPNSGRISNTKDNFLFVNTETTGEIDMRLRVRSYDVSKSSQSSPPTPPEQHCSGLMIRQSLDPGARHFSILYCGDKRVRRVRRNNPNERAAGTYDSGNRATDVMEGDVWLRITFGLTSSNPNTFLVFTSTDVNPSDEDWDDLGWGGGFPGSEFTRSSNFFVGIGLSRFTFEASDFTVNGAPALPNDLVIPSTPPSVEGYTAYNQRMCNNDSFLEVDGIEDENGFIKVSSAQACASHCNNMQDCVSFDFVANQYCRLSSSCDHFSLTDPDAISQWYFKDIDPPGYAKYTTGGCDGGVSQDLATVKTDSVQECANLCSMDPSCISFAYRKTGSTTCLLSSTCDYEKSIQKDGDAWNLYTKEDNEDVCPFLPYSQAEVCCFMS